MLEGTVKWFSEKKKFGFITADSGQEYFVHAKSIVDHGFFTMQKDDRVRFDIRDTRQGEQAVQVKVISS